MNRKPKQVRDRNYTFQDQQQSQWGQQQSYKEQKLNQITEHRKMAILGGKQEKVMLQRAYRDEAEKLMSYQQTKKQQQRAEEIAVERRIQEKYASDNYAAMQQK